MVNDQHHAPKASYSFSFMTHPQAAAILGGKLAKEWFPKYLELEDTVAESKHG